MLGWLVVDGDLPESVLRQLLAALTARELLMGAGLFAVEPLAGPECDVADLLEAQWWRRAEQAECAGATVWCWWRCAGGSGWRSPTCVAVA